MSKHKVSKHRCPSIEIIITIVSIKLGESKRNKGVNNLPATTVEYVADGESKSNKGVINSTADTVEDVEDGLGTIEESDFDGIEFREPKKRRLRGAAK